MAGNRRAVKYYIFYPGGLKESPIFLVADSSTTHPDDLMIRVITKTPHIIVRVTRTELMIIMENHMRNKRGNSYFARDRFQNYLTDINEFEKVLSYQLGIPVGEFLK